MRRRRLLAALGSAAVAGCAAFDAGPAETLTPAEVPATPGPTPTPPPAGGAPCPELPEAAERYRCSSELSGGLRLVPTTAAADTPEFVLTNRTDRPFETGRDRWVLAARSGERWRTVGAGAATDRLAVEPGGLYAWRVGGPADPPPGTVRVDVAVGAGVHAFVVYGDVDGTRTAVAAPFRVPASG